MYKSDEQKFNLKEIDEEAWKTGDFEEAFWDEFFSQGERKRQTLTIEQLDDGRKLKIKTTLTRLKAN